MRLFPFVITILFGACRLLTASPVLTTVQQCMIEGVLSNGASCTDGATTVSSTFSYSISSGPVFLADLLAYVMPQPFGRSPDNVGAYISATLDMALYGAGPVRPGVLNYQFSDYQEDEGNVGAVNFGFQPEVESQVSVEGVSLDPNNPPYGGLGSAPITLGVPFDVTFTAISSGGCMDPCGWWIAHPSIRIQLYDPAISSAVGVQVVPEPNYNWLLGLVAAVRIGRQFYRRSLRM